MDDPERIARDYLACQLTLNNTPPPDGVYCNGTFDSWLCWPPTRAGDTAYARCPDFVPGFRSDLMAHKECMEDGTWWLHPATSKPWSNYTTCVQEEDDLTGVIVVYETGYSISLLLLLISIGILAYFKNLRCPRNTLHINLFLSFALNNLLWLGWYRLVMREPGVVAASPGWCRALQAAVQYALLATYTWMLCEGAYLHTVLLRAFTSETRLLRILVPAGWLLPLPSAIYSAVSRYRAGDELCWMEEGGPRAEVAVLACAAVLLNLAFLCNIVRVLCGKLRTAPSLTSPNAQNTVIHALRATCLLAPLLGLQFLLTPFRPTREASGWLAYEYVSALIASLQGALVALLYCFLNGEVRAALRRTLRRPRANSHTTVSFVRSAGGGGGGGEDKV